MRAIVADDHPLYREAVRLRLARLFAAADIAEASTVDELLASGAVGTERIDLILLDLHMPGMAAPGAIGHLIAAFPGTPVVLMSGLASVDEIKEGIRAGALGYLPKTMSADLFAAAISIVLGGGSYLPAEILDSPPNPALAETPARTMLEGLTPREQQVLVRLATGAPNKEIGRELALAEVTVKLHVRQILRKIGARNRSEAASIATKAGLI